MKNWVREHFARASATIDSDTSTAKHASATPSRSCVLRPVPQAKSNEGRTPARCSRARSASTIARPRRAMYAPNGSPAQPASASDERSEHRSDDACGNWLWLVDLARWERALDVQGGIGSMTAALARHFTSVHYVDAARPPLEFARARFREDRSANVACAQAGAGALPYPNATFDCVVWDGALGRGVSGV